MVSCQWRLTSGPRAGQACGKGKEVFCKTHAPKAEQELDSIFRHWKDNPVTKYLSPSGKTAKRVLFGDTRGESRLDFSKSWIWDENRNRLRGDLSEGVGSVRLLDEICYPQTVANWLEDVYSTSLVRGDQIFPQLITEQQLNALDNLWFIFRKRMSEDKAIQNFYIYQIQDSRTGRPLPFFQNRSNLSRENLPKLYNDTFIVWMQRCINYSPNYTALWNWFLPKFTNNMVESLNAIKRGYDTDAISNDLKALRLAYMEERQRLQQQNIQNQPTNRYQQDR